MIVIILLIIIIINNNSNNNNNINKNNMYIDDKQSIAGSMHYKAPEVLMSYNKSTTSSDMWSYGCILASWLFKIETFFNGDDNINQLYHIAKVFE